MAAQKRMAFCFAQIVRQEILGHKIAGLAIKEYPDSLRRITARVEINGQERVMVFLTNNFEWAASTIAELYKARWEWDNSVPYHNSCSRKLWYNTHLREI